MRKEEWQIWTCGAGWNEPEYEASFDTLEEAERWRNTHDRSAIIILDSDDELIDQF